MLSLENSIRTSQQLVTLLCINKEKRQKQTCLPLAAIFDNFLIDDITFFLYLKIGKKDMHSIKPKGIAEI